MAFWINRANRIDVDLSKPLKVYYRISSSSVSGQKSKLHFATKIVCLQNAIDTFGASSITLFVDSVEESLRENIKKTGVAYVETNAGSGGANFRAAAEAAMADAEDTPVYLVEDDFFHRSASRNVIFDGLGMNQDYVTLYDHPDKYLSKNMGGNPFVEDGGEKTRLLCGEVAHWKITNSTVMTFATTAGRLKRDWSIFLQYCGGRYTDDFGLFRKLSKRGKNLISSVPGYATHCETAWLSPLHDWTGAGKDG